MTTAVALQAVTCICMDFYRKNPPAHRYLVEFNCFWSLAGIDLSNILHNQQVTNPTLSRLPSMPWLPSIIALSCTPAAVSESRIPKSNSIPNRNPPLRLGSCSLTVHPDQDEERESSRMFLMRSCVSFFAASTLCSGKGRSRSRCNRSSHEVSELENDPHVFPFRRFVHSCFRKIRQSLVSLAFSQSPSRRLWRFSHCRIPK